MTTPATQFAYTRVKGDFLAAIAGWLMVFAIEGSIVALLIAVLADGWWRVALLTGFLGAIGLVVVRLILRPLFTRHVIAGDELTLRLGGASVSMPLGAIERAVALPGDRRLVVRGAPHIESGGTRLTLPFSREGLVELSLREPVAYSDRDGDALIDTIVLNVDDRDAFLAAVAPGAPFAAVTPPALSLAALAEAMPAGSTAAPGESVLAVSNLTRRFGDLRAVDGVSFDLHAGEILGCIGGNGAGKTTTIKMLVGLIRPDGGTVDLPTDAPPMTQLGYMPDKPILYERLTVREFLSIIAQMRGIDPGEAASRIEELLRLLDLAAHGNRLCGACSYGMKRKLSLAAAVLHRPRVLILDEPLNGLDPVSARRVKSLLRALADDERCAVFVSMHDLGTVESLCDRVLVMHEGQVLIDATARDLMRRTDAGDLESAYLALIDTGRVS